MVEFLKHTLGICGDHWHPNIWTAVASTPIIAPMVYYIKCKFSSWFKSKDKKNL